MSDLNTDFSDIYSLELESNCRDIYGHIMNFSTDVETSPSFPFFKSPFSYFVLFSS